MQEENLELESVPQQLKGLDTFSKLLDSTFRIPFTDIRFGVDFLVGLIPYGGDLLSFLFSGGLVLTMARHGASGMVLIKMLFNIFLDAVVGSVPILGDIFDLFYKANRRNYHLLVEHYGDGEHQGSGWIVVIPVLITLILLFVLMIWLVVKMASWGFGVLF